MSKKYLLLSALTLLTTVEANAGHFYVGPYIGLGATQGEFKASNASGSTTRKNNFGENSFIGGLMAGYSYPCNNWFVGGELLGNFDTLSEDIISEKNGNGIGPETFKLRRRSNFGFAARLGMKIVADVVLYVRFGGEWTNAKLSYTGVDGTISTTVRDAKSKTLFAFVPGIGIEAPIANKWKVRIEGKHSLSRKLNLRVPTAPGGNSLIFDGFNTKVKTSQTSVIMGVTYSF